MLDGARCSFLRATMETSDTEALLINLNVVLILFTLLTIVTPPSVATFLPASDSGSDSGSDMVINLVLPILPWLRQAKDESGLGSLSATAILIFGFEVIQDESIKLCESLCVQ